MTQNTTLQPRRALALLLTLALFLPQAILASEPPTAETPRIEGTGFTVTLGAVRNNTLYEDASGSLSNGAGQYLFVGRTLQGTDDLRRALLLFDIAGSLPSDATILSADLVLEMSLTIAPATTVSVHRATSDWGEGTSMAGGQEGGGGASTTGDATWIHTFFDTATWTSPGGDFDASASASTSVASEGIYLWSSATLAMDVQGWLDTPATNFGWLLLGDEAASPPTAKRFNSRNNGTSSSRPQLTVSFDSPSTVFLDGFESSDTNAWSFVTP